MSGQHTDEKLLEFDHVAESVRERANRGSGIKKNKSKEKKTVEVEEEDDENKE